MICYGIYLGFWGNYPGTCLEDFEKIGWRSLLLEIEFEHVLDDLECMKC